MQTWMKFERKPYVCTPPCDQFANYSPSKKRKESLNTLKSAPILSTLSSGRRPVLQSVTIFCLSHLGWTRGRGRQGSEIHRDVCPPHPLPFLRGIGGCKKNEKSNSWGFLYQSDSKFETVKDDSKYTLPQKLVTHLLQCYGGYSAPATYYLSLDLVFTQLHLQAGSLLSGHRGYLFLPYMVQSLPMANWIVYSEEQNVFTLLSLVLKPLFPSHFIKSAFLISELLFTLY